MKTAQFMKCTGAALAALAIATTAFAESVSTISFSSPLCGGLQPVTYTANGAISMQLAEGSGICQVGLTARAGNGSVGILAAMDVSPGAIGSEPSVSTATLSAKSETEINLDFSESELMNFPVGLIPVSLQAHLDGFTSVSAQGISGFFEGGESALLAQIMLSGFNVAGSSVSSSNVVSISSAASSSTSSGPRTDADLFPDSLLAPTIFIDPTRPVTVEFSLSGGVTQRGHNDAFIVSTLDALNTLSFALDGPA
ncbi:MAG: hypothetical protein ACI9BW_004617, partial [Gammaproteobacteria bacterium]